MKQLVWGGLAAAALATILWQNRSASERMDKLGEHVDALAARPPAPRAPREIIVSSVAPPPETSAPAPAPPSPPVEPEQQEQRRQHLAAAQRQADDIVRSGRLTPDDVGSLRAQLAELPRAEAFEIRRRIAHAINTQQVDPTEIPFTLP